MSPELQLQLYDAHPYAPGETIKGNVLVVEGGRSRSLRVELRYNEKTKDYLNVPTMISAAPLHEAISRGRPRSSSRSLCRGSAPELLHQPQ